MTTPDFDATGSARNDAILDEFSEGTETTTAYDRLAQELASRKILEPIRVKVPARPAITLIFDPNLDVERVAFWRKKSFDKGLQDTNTLKLAVTTIVNQCRSIEIDGDEVRGPDGEPLTFRDKTFLRMLQNENSAVGAVRWLFGSDADILDTLYKIIEGAGFAKDDDEDADDVLDPTQSS